MPVTDAKRLHIVFADRVCDVLDLVGVGAEDIARERLQMSEIAFGPTRNRSLLGTLNDFTQMAKYGHGRDGEAESTQELMRFLAQTPILPLDGASPIDLTLAAFDRR
jgi:hypothetical protein